MSGIQRRWILNSLGVSVLVAVIGLTAFAAVVSNSFTSSMQTSLQTQASSYAAFISKNYTDSYNTFYQNIRSLMYEFNSQGKFEMQVINRYGTLLDSSNRNNATHLSGIPIETPDVKAAQAGYITPWVGDDPVTGERILAVSVPMTLQGIQSIGAIRCVTSMERVGVRVFQYVGIGIGVCLLFILFIVSINLLFLRGILVPVREINRVSKRIAEGGYGVRIEKTYRDEMGELVDNINHMSGEIGAAERLKNDFISSVSHELRTPLTAINGWGETLLNANMNDSGEIRKGLRIILKETSRLSNMVEELLDFTRIESGRMRLDISPIDIASELEEIIYLHMDALKRDGIALTYTQPDEVPGISGDRARLKQVFVNILDNAAKHGGSGKRIDAALTVEPDWVVITVRDYGPGIPESELPHVKYKFYKGSSSVRGSGIGLSVSDEIMRLHGGELLIESAEGEGTTVRLRLPRAVDNRKDESF
ncbi:MAG: HAMP domain-containing histidine kinase [Oscillospiraceae bacterium]|jgi:signal transduction histidine kinase|nr:HAMP domain-containing histidine kinase [Oscillospiraceae bacterium]